MKKQLAISLCPRACPELAEGFAFFWLTWADGNVLNVLVLRKAKSEWRRAFSQRMQIRHQIVELLLRQLVLKRRHLRAA